MTRASSARLTGQAIHVCLLKSAIFYLLPVSLSQLFSSFCLLTNVNIVSRDKTTLRLTLIKGSAKKIKHLFLL